MTSPISPKHGRLTIEQGIHAAISFEYANAAARNAATGFQDYDLYKLAVDIDTGLVSLITNVNSGTVTWQNVGSSGGTVGGDLSGTLPNPSVIDLTITGQQQGSILYFNGSHWVVLNPGTDGYVLTTHNTGNNPTWEEASGGGGAGLSNSAPINVDAGVASAGTSILAARGDHKHSISIGTPISIGSVNSAGTSNNLVRADHTHSVVDLNIAGQAKGDILFFDGSNWVVLAAGNDGYILTAQGAGANPAWEPNAGGEPFGISAGTQLATIGTVAFVNSNGISFGMSNSSQITASYTVPTQTNFSLSNLNGISFGTNGSTVTASYTVPSTAGLISAINISGGTTSNNLTNIVFSNSNNISFGLNGSTITGSVLSQSIQTQNVVVPSAGTQTATSGTVSFVNSNGITFGMSNSNQITASYTVPSTAGLISNINVSAGTTSNNLSAITFSNSNGLAFGLNGSTITGSYTIPTQTNQTEGLYVIGNTTGQSSSSTFDARTLSISGAGNISAGYSGNALVISGSQSNQTANIVVPSAGTQTATSGTVIFSNSNGITFGMSNSSVVTASYTVPSTAGLISAVNVSAGTTSNNLSAITFSNSNGLTFGLNGSTITGSYTVPTQTNQTEGMYAIGNTTGQSSSSTFDARTMSVSGAGSISVGYSGNALLLSVSQTAQTQNVVVPSAGTQTATSGTVIFSNSNGITFGMSNSSIVTASYTVPTQTNQTIGLFGLGNTTQNSSTTLDARSLSFNGLGIVTVGYSNGSIQVSATQSNQTEGRYAIGNTVGQSSSSTFDARTLSISGAGIASVGYSGNALVVSVPSAGALVNISAGTTSNNLGSIVYSNSNNVSFGLNGSTITASVLSQSNQTEGFYAVGNTVGQSSSSTFDARTVSFSGAGIASVGYSAGNVLISVPSAGALVNVSAGTTSNNLGSIVFSNSNNISFGLNGSTVTGSVLSQSNQSIGLFALGNTTQNSSTTLDARSLSFNGLGIITAGYSNGSIQLSATTAAQTNQTVGLYALGNTTQNSSTTLDARTISFNGLGAATVGYSNGSVQISVPNALTNINILAGTTSNNLTNFVLSNSNGISFGLNGSTVTASYTVPTQTNQTEGMYAIGNTTGQSSSSTFDARTMSVSGAGSISIGYSGNALLLSVSQTAQTQNVVVPSAGTQTATSGTVIFSNSNGISFGMSNSSVITASYTVPSTAGLISAINVSAGTTSNNLSALTFSNSNGLAFGLNGSTITGSYTVPTQTNQTIGLFGLGNTTQNSSTTLDARSLSFNGLGIITVGYSNGSIQLSATQSNQTDGLYAIGNTTGQSSSSTFDARTLSISGAGIASVGYSGNALVISVPSAGASINFSAGTTSNNLNAITFSNSNNVSFGLNGSTITATATFSQTNQTEGMYAIGNTTGQSSSSTFDARTLSVSGGGGVSVGYSNNALVISGSSPKLNQLIWPENPWQTNFSISNASLSLQHFNAKQNITATQMNLLMALSGNTNSSGALTVSLAIYTMSGSTLSLASSDSRQITWTSGSQTSASSLFGGVSGTRYRTIGLNNWAISAGDYVVGAWFRTTNDGSWNIFGQQGPTIVGAVDINETNNYAHGYYTTSFSTGMIASFNITDTNYARTGGNALQQPGLIFLGTF